MGLEDIGRMTGKRIYFSSFLFSGNIGESKESRGEKGRGKGCGESMRDEIEYCDRMALVSMREVSRARINYKERKVRSYPLTTGTPACCQ